MALRIGGMKKPELPAEPLPEEAPPIPEPEAEAPPEETPEEPPMDEPLGAGGAVPPGIAGYRGPEMGPFFCANCQHFGKAGPNTCEVVSGPIEEEGLCNLFNSMDEHQPEMEEGESEDVPVEPPVEPEVPEEGPPQ